MATVDALNQEVNQATDGAKQTDTQVQNDISNLPTEVQHQIQASLNKAKTALTQVSGNVDTSVTGYLFNCLTWAGLGLVGVFIGELVGANVFSGIMQSILGNWASIITIAILEPLTVWVGYKVLKQNEERETLLGFSVLLGVLIGSALKGRQMEFSVPPPALLPLVMAVAAYATRLVANDAPVVLSDRKIFLPILILPAMATFYVFGPREKGISFFMYMAVLFVVSFIDVQVKLEESGQGSTTEQWATVVVLGIANQVAFTLMSSSTE